MRSAVPNALVSLKPQRRSLPPLAGLSSIGTFPKRSGASVWNATLLWASAVKKAGSIETNKVIAALESGLALDSPNGAITLDPRSHHLVQSIFIAKGNDKRDFDIIETHSRVAPVFEQKVCDLVAHPELAKHFTSLDDASKP
jgi:urea transport system substrate-binding protein